ncbi:MAG: hypothetical protein VKJ24_13535 [Synechococcales bacterium]|nr:hypothetical protein [Synechococcales bacterium]
MVGDEGEFGHGWETRSAIELLKDVSILLQVYSSATRRGNTKN